MFSFPLCQHGLFLSGWRCYLIADLVQEFSICDIYASDHAVGCYGPCLDFHVSSARNVNVILGWLQISPIPWLRSSSTAIWAVILMGSGAHPHILW